MSRTQKRRLERQQRQLIDRFWKDWLHKNPDGPKFDRHGEPPDWIVERGWEFNPHRKQPPENQK